MVWISSTRRSPCKWPAPARRYSPAASWPSLTSAAWLAGPLRHVHASRVPGLLRGLRPTPRLQRTVRLSRHRGWSPRGGTGTRWFPCSPRIDRPGRHPALPRQHRHGYAAGLHRDLPTGTPSRFGVGHPPAGMTIHCTRPISARFEPVPRYGALPPVPVRMPSVRSPDPHHLAVLARPGFVSAASRPPRHLPDQAALSFHQAAATTRREGLPPPPTSAPHGAPAPHGARRSRL